MLQNRCKEGLIMPEKSFIEYAYEVMSASKEPLSFKELFEKTLELSGLQLSQNELKLKMSKLYTSLSVDGRFTNIDGKWDLSSRYTFQQSHKSVDDFDEDDDEDDEEEKELLRQELGEEQEDDSERESDDIDFDKPQVDAEDDDEF